VVLAIDHDVVEAGCAQDTSLGDVDGVVTGRTLTDGPIEQAADQAAVGVRRRGRGERPAADGAATEGTVDDLADASAAAARLSVVDRP
jgi:hypothetical protein